MDARVKLLSVRAVMLVVRQLRTTTGSITAPSLPCGGGGGGGVGGGGRGGRFTYYLTAITEVNAINDDAWSTYWVSTSWKRSQCKGSRNMT